MSDTTINLTAFTDGLLTDLTSIEFSDSGGSYGLRRTDNGDVVLAAGTSFPRTALGTYQKIFTDPAVDLTYEYTLKVVSGGETYYYNRISAAGTLSHVYLIPTSSHYSSQAEVARQLGQNALDLMLEDWESNDTSQVWDDVLDEVDETIDLYITHKYPAHSFSNTFLRRIATKMSCNLISGRRGNPALYIREANLAMEKLQDIRAGQLNIPGNILPIGNTGPVVRNYIMQPFAYHPMRVETTKSTGDSYSRLDMALTPYLMSW